MDYSPKYLICVDGEFGSQGHNKVYKMTKTSDSSFTAEWGRVGGSMASKDYPLSKWNSTYTSKIKKGYVDRSDLMTDIIEDSKVNSSDTVSSLDEFSAIKCLSVREIIKRLFDFSNKVIQASYRVSSEQVTQAMVDTAQKYIDELSNKYNSLSVTEFNTILNNLFITIPRKMGYVKDYLASDNESFTKIIEREQELLDTMRGQVYKKVEKHYNDDPNTNEKDLNSEPISILDKMGITMEDASEEDVAKIKKAMGDAANKFYKAWRVSNKETEEKYKKFVEENHIGNVKLTCHGSRNQNWFNILKTGLKIRPAGAITTGNMFGYGCYWSNPEKWHGVAKSIGYTSLGGYWTKDYQNCGFIAFFECALGDTLDVYSFDSKYYNFTLDSLKKEKKSAWSLFAHGGTGMLQNDEIIVYHENQMTIRYLVEIR